MQRIVNIMNYLSPTTQPTVPLTQLSKRTGVSYVLQVFVKVVCSATDY